MNEQDADKIIETLRLILNHSEVLQEVPTELLDKVQFALEAEIWDRQLSD
jgi:Asp-tRNA(Asn)/Glu-tRNA(Gln) amidotransferase C subunit